MLGGDEAAPAAARGEGSLTIVNGKPRIVSQAQLRTAERIQTLSEQWAAPSPSTPTAGELRQSARSSRTNLSNRLRHSASSMLTGASSLWPSSMCQSDGPHLRRSGMRDGVASEPTWKRAEGVRNG